MPTPQSNIRLHDYYRNLLDLVRERRGRLDRSAAVRVLIVEEAERLGLGTAKPPSPRKAGRPPKK